MPTRPNIPPGPHSRAAARNYSRTIEKANKYDNYNIPAIVTPRLYEADIIKAATQPRTYVPAYPKPKPTPTNTPPVAGDGGPQTLLSPGLTVQEPAPDPYAVDLSKNPYPGYYDTLLDFIRNNANARPAEYAYTGEQFKRNQDIANQQMYNMYTGSRQGADASATALGVDPAVISQYRDLAMRQSQENSDQSLADNLAWLSKMGILSKQQAEASLNQYAGEKVTKSAGWVASEQQRMADLQLANLQAALKAKSGGGGGGGRRGGGSSSKSDTSVTETSTLDDSSLLAYQELAKTDPEAAAAYLNSFNLTMGTGQQKLAQQKVNDATSLAKIPYHPTVSKPNIYAPKPNATNVKWQAAGQTMLANAAKAAHDQAIWNKVLQAAGLGSGKGANPTNKVTITKKGKPS